MNMEAVLRAAAWVEQHLTEPVGVEGMAAAAGYSLFHFSRMFNGLVQQPPYDYLLRRRLCEAARMLQNADVRAIDAAMRYQFNSPEVFSRAFVRVIGETPSAWRLSGRVDARRFLPPLTREYLQVLQQQNEWQLKFERIEPAALNGSWTIYRYDREPQAFSAAAGEWLAMPEDAQILLRFSFAACLEEVDLVCRFLYHCWLPRAGYCPAGAADWRRGSAEPARQNDVLMRVRGNVKHRLTNTLTGKHLNFII